MNPESKKDACRFSIDDFRLTVANAIDNRHSSIVNSFKAKGAIRNPSRGITLFELLTASTLALVVILAIGQVDVARVHLTQSTRLGSTTALREAGLALTHMVKSLERADRVELLASPQGNLQFRIPLGTDFDNPANYRWGQYRRVGSRIRFYDDTVFSGCTVDYTFFDIRGLTITRTNNVVELAISTRDPKTGTVFTYRDRVILRAASFTNPTGLDTSGVSNPPAGC